ncbi:MAG: YceI family protein [Deltaproteobacteria bacterium]|nr:YceI family protein [Deltaproteobacteria bacterium]
MRKRRALFLFALAALVALPASAFAADWSYDSAHTTVGFKVKHLGLVYVHGTFDEFSGTISWDGKDLTTGDASVTIKAASVNTSNAKRDKHLREGFF